MITIDPSADAPRPPRFTLRPAHIWALAVPLALLGTTIFFDASAGINWGLWVVGVLAGLGGIIKARDGRVGTPVLVVGAWTIVIAFGLAVTTDLTMTRTIVATTLLLLALTLVIERASSFDMIIPRYVITAPPRALFWVVRGTFREVVESGTHVGARDARATIRGIIITVPVVLVLIAILSSADPIFNLISTSASRFIRHIISGETIFFTVLLTATLGAYAEVVRRHDTHAIVVAPIALHLLGETERRILLVSVTGIVWLFVASACVSMWLDPAATTGSGVTYADYARRGFAELSIAATLVVGVVLGVDRFNRTANTSPTRFVPRTSLLALAAVAAMLVIAMTRVLQYEWAYGYTVARVQAQAYMVGLALALVILALEVARKIPPRRFTRYAGSVALALLVIMIYWNTDAWVVNRNIDRYIVAGKLDTDYLRTLSEDAVPTIARRAATLRPPERELIETDLQCRVSWQLENEFEWFEWNARRSRAQQAIRPFRARGCPKH